MHNSCYELEMLQVSIQDWWYDRFHNHSQFQWQNGLDLLFDYNFQNDIHSKCLEYWCNPPRYGRNNNHWQ